MSDFYQEVYSQDNPQGEAHGWIQWKGTSVCVDLHCKCGYHGHVDAEFAYYYKCPKCSKIFALGQNIKLIELTEDQSKEVLTRSAGCVTTCELEEDR